MKIIFSASAFLLLAPVVVATTTTTDNSSRSRSSALLLRGGDAHTAAAAAIPRTHKSSTTILWETSKQHQPREIVEDVELQRRLQQRELKPTQKIVGGEEAEAWEYRTSMFFSFSNFSRFLFYKVPSLLFFLFLIYLHFLVFLFVFNFPSSLLTVPSNTAYYVDMSWWYVSL